MNIVLFDTHQRLGLLPLTFTSSAASLRVGIFTNLERWQALSGWPAFIHTVDYLQPLYGEIPAGKNLWVNASILPGKKLADEILSLTEGHALAGELGFIAGILDIAPGDFNAATALALFQQVHHANGARHLQYPWQIFQWNDELIREDFEIITQHRVSEPLPASGHFVNPSQIFIEKGAEVSCAALNASAGPIYISKNAVVMEGALVRGPLALCEGAVLKMGAKVYGATTIGPYSIAGGEIKNSVIQAFSNKGHDGYLGDAVIGQWCNLGAGTSNSNVKNTGDTVKMWSYADEAYLPVGKKGGLIMGDYSRTAINTSLNTGTVIGVCCNVFNQGLLPRHIQNFAWGCGDNTRYHFDKAERDISNWKKMKGHELNNAEKNVLNHIFESF